MPTVGALTIPFTIGTAAVVNQASPLFWLIYSTDDLAAATPHWSDASTYLRSFNTSRGRDNELSEIEAGTASFTLDNRTRVFDPISTPTIKPCNRWWLMEQFAGKTNSVFYGYAESYDQLWPALNDAVAVANCSDELAVLSRTAVPNMDPPRDTYADLVAFDNPTNYWRWSDSSMTSTEMSQTTEMPTYHWTYSGFEWDTITSTWTVSGFQNWTVVTGVGFSSSFGSNPIVGDLQDLTTGLGGYLNMTNASSDEIKATDISIGDPMSATAFTFETWFQKTGNPVGNTNFVEGPESNVAAVRTWSMTLNTTGTVSFNILDSGNTARAVTSTTALANATWYHLVGELDGANLRIFVNGVQEATATSGTGSFRPTNTATGAPMRIKHAAVTQIDMDETACYLKVALPVARALAHYNAGALRGFRGGAALGLPHLRAIGVLDAVSNHAPRNIRTGTRGMQPVFQHGQNPLDELRKCALAELPESMLFVDGDGTIVLLDAAHKTVSPWSTSQMTFNDPSSPPDTAGYLIDDGLVTDYSDSFLFNEWNASRTGGQLVTSSDATSISAYGKRSQTLGDLPLTTDADVPTITAALLAKYKDAMYRITQIKPQMADATTCDMVMQRKLGDKVTINRHPPGGGTTIVQTSWIQKIETSWSASNPIFINVTLGVSPV